MSPEETKEAMKEALKEWLDEKAAKFGYFSMYTIAAAVIVGLGWFVLITHGWKPPV